MKTMTETQEMKLLQDLGKICTRNEDGKHFTELDMDWEEMERRGWIEVYRPMHGDIQYSMEYWKVEITESGESALREAGLI
jgi:hypothetical protein